MALFSKDFSVLRRKSSIDTIASYAVNNKRSKMHISFGSQLFSKCLRSPPFAFTFRSSYNVLVSHDENEEFENIRQSFLDSITILETFAPWSSSSAARLEKQWNETVSATFFAIYRTEKGTNVIRLQCAIHELFSCEYNLCYNLRLLTHLYRPLLLETGLMSLVEANQVFGHLEQLYSVHETFVERMAALRNSSGEYQAPGGTMDALVSNLVVYSSYCSNLAKAKALVKAKLKTPAFANLLATNALVRDFGQKLDLSSHLDQPRRHLMKYTLLLGRIVKLTAEHETNELSLLQQAIDKVHEVLINIERQITEQTYRQIIDKFVFESEKGKQETDDINRSRLAESDIFVHRCQIAYRARRGKQRKASLHLFLFNRCIVIAQRMSSSVTTTSRYQVLETISPTGRLWYEMANNTKKNRLKGRSKLFWGLQRKIFHKLRSASTRNQVRLYNEVTTGQSFDIRLKLQTPEEVSLWIKRLKTYYTLVSNETNATTSRSRTATTLSCSYVLE